jgi:methylmalonyl-CoA mutase
LKVEHEYAPADAFLTAEGIELKTYSEQDIENIKHLDFGAGFAPNLRGPYATMYVRRPWTVRQYAGFSTAEESNAFTDETWLLVKKGLSIAFDLLHTAVMIRITNAWWEMWEKQELRSIPWKGKCC